MTLNLLRKRRELIAACSNEAQHYVDYFRSDSEQLAEDLGGFEGKRVLDIGCGLSYPQVTIFQCLGAQVVGIDIEALDRRARLKSIVNMMRSAGARNTLRNCAVASIVNSPLSREIGRLMGVTGPLPPPDVRCGDALNLDFPDGSFDLVYSHAVYEHLPDIGRALDETARVLAPGGLMRLAIHLYPSLTGGHTGKVGRPGEHVPPWDHLRERSVPPTSYLNEMREPDYRREIEARFEILKWVLHKREQAAELLTEEIEKDLAARGYGREELLTETLVVHARKR